MQLLQQVADKLVRFAQLVGVAPEQMISLLDSGISIRDLLVFLVSRRSEPDNDAAGSSRSWRSCSPTPRSSQLGGTRPMTDKRLRAIAALKVELRMTEAHAQKLSATVPSLAHPNQQHQMALLIKEENDRAEQLRRMLCLLRDQS